MTDRDFNTLLETVEDALRYLCEGEYHDKHKAALEALKAIKHDVTKMRAGLERIAEGPFDPRRTRGFAGLAQHIARINLSKSVR